MLTGPRRKIMWSRLAPTFISTRPRAGGTHRDARNRCHRAPGSVACMCGRYAASASQDQLVEVFTIDEVPGVADPAALRPRWNIAPTQPVAAVVQRLHREGAGDMAAGRGPAEGQRVGTRKLVTPRWGLVPSWSKDPGAGARLVNARAETVGELPSFRKAFASRRCLVPADGYYEWYPLTEPDGTPVRHRGRPVKQPFFIHPSGGAVVAARPAGPGQDALPGLMAMAGIYEFWRNAELPPDHPDAWLTTCAIITTSATDDLGRIHDRMPMQVRPGDWDAWLDPCLTDPGAAHELLHAPAPGEMAVHAVSTAVNSVRHDGPELVRPLPVDEAPAEPTATGAPAREP